MRSTRLAAAAVGSVVALVGFASGANASATLDLIWIDVTDSTCTNANRRDCPQTGPLQSDVFTSNNITLAVIVTAGSGGYVGGQMSVDYSDALPTLSVVGFRRLLTTFPEYYLPFDISDNAIHDTGARIETMLTTAAPFLGEGIGLPAGHTAYIGTVTFHKDILVNGTFEISVDTLGPGDDLGNLELDVISATSTYNSAFLTTVTTDPGWCTDSQGNFMEIEINALRAGGKTIATSLNHTTKVTSKARILKGTAVSGTTIVTTLTIEAFDGEVSISEDSQPDITLGVGKGGNGASFDLLTEQCDSGFIAFVAEFRGVDGEGESCIGTRELRKECK